MRGEGKGSLDNQEKIHSFIKANDFLFKKSSPPITP